MSITNKIGECILDIDKSANIYPNVTLLGKVSIGANCTILSGSVIKNSIIGENSIIKSSYIEESCIGSNVTIGPFAHIRPGSIIENNCKIGNFVEVKNSRLSEGTKASHLAYIGDAEIGKNCNIGCGAIFVNYNGKEKQHTRVGNNCFIGSNCNIIAPVNIKDNSYICAGTTLTIDTNEFDFVIGRCRETIKPNHAKKYFKKD
ncbi:MAG: hypothetical protein E7354_03070 [Clostridiales bacterium]|nr:hypothetical protein [Clostridiales bacterium]